MRVITEQNLVQLFIGGRLVRLNCPKSFIIEAFESDNECRRSFLLLESNKHPAWAGVCGSSVDVYLFTGHGHLGSQLKGRVPGVIGNANKVCDPRLFPLGEHFTEGENFENHFFIELT
jgi:hypothetical protein